MCVKYILHILNVSKGQSASNTVLTQCDILPKSLCDLSTGRSMGCRAATALARQLSDESEEAVRGVICLSFPLHPPGQTRSHRQRGDDLRALPEHMSVLFVSGTEDSMCDRVRMLGGSLFSRHYILYTKSYSCGVFIL